VIANSGHGPAVLGLQRFPSAEANACGVAPEPEVTLAEQDAAVLLAALPESEISGASPAAGGYASALEHVLAEWDEDRAAWIVLVTDGRSNCAADDELLSLVSDAFSEHGVVTLVVAIDEAADPSLESGPDSVPVDPRPALHQLGFAGGHPPDFMTGYWSASDREPLAHMLSDLIIDDPSCEFDLTHAEPGPPTPEQIPLVTWTIDGELVPLVELEVCDTEYGWAWVEPGMIVQFCGQACDDMQAAQVVEGIYGCP
jgi:hypothetical protein